MSEKPNKDAIDRFVQTHYGCLVEVGNVCGGATMWSCVGSMASTLALYTQTTPEDFRAFLKEVGDQYEENYEQASAMAQPAQGRA